MDETLNILKDILDYIKNTQLTILGLLNMPPGLEVHLQAHASDERFLRWIQSHDIVEQQLKALINYVETIEVSLASVSNLPEITSLYQQLKKDLKNAQKQRNAFLGNSNVLTRSEIDYF